MEEITTIKNHTLHRFYCKDCGRYIGESLEFSDGYYQKLGSVEFDICIQSKWYELKTCLCDKCKDKFISNVINTLDALGFKAR